MSLPKKYGVRPGDQVPLSVANRQAALASQALRARQEAAADAAATAVAKALKGSAPKPARSPRALRAKPNKEQN